MRFAQGMGLAVLIAAAAPVAAPAQTTREWQSTTANDPTRGGWGEPERRIDREAVARSAAKMRAPGGLFGGGSFQFMFLPVGLIFIIAKLTLAHYLRKNRVVVEKVYDYHEPEPVKWKPRDPAAEARMKILEPDYIQEPKAEAAVPVPARPMRQFGKRGL